MEDSLTRHPQSSGVDDGTAVFLLRLKPREENCDLTIVESTLHEVGREKPRFAEKTRFRGETGDMRIEDSIAANDLKTEKHHL